MILYFTINDHPSGVYWSQVTDVVNMLDRDARYEVRLLALVSIRGYFKIRKQIRARCPKAIVLPMYPKAQNWKKNIGMLGRVCRRRKVQAIIARGAFATALAIGTRENGSCKKVCFDARGAYAAEWQEYRIINDDALIATVPEVEKKAVLKSDYRLSVSNALVQHWREEYGYISEEHVVIPCTLGADHVVVDDEKRAEIRAGLSVSETDTLLVYSGSTAGWQSFDLLKKMLTPALQNNKNLKVLFLSKEDENNSGLKKQFPDQVFVQWLGANEVPTYLAACDLGILLREDTVTNRVSSPTKFAEYLNAGLNVLISAHIGDFSAFVAAHNCGTVVGQELGMPERPSDVQREKNRELAKSHFTKEAFAKDYARIMQQINK